VDRNAVVLTGDDVELRLGHFGWTVSLPEGDLRVVLSVNVLGQAWVHSVVPLIDRCHQQVAVRALSELLHVDVVLHYTVVEQPRDGSVRQRFGNARQVHRHPVPSPHLLNHVAGVHWRKLDGQMTVFCPFAALRLKRWFFTIILMFTHIGNSCNTRSKVVISIMSFIIVTRIIMRNSNFWNCLYRTVKCQRLNYFLIPKLIVLWPVAIQTLLFQMRTSIFYKKLRCTFFFKCWKIFKSKLVASFRVFH